MSDARPLPNQEGASLFLSRRGTQKILPDNSRPATPHKNAPSPSKRVGPGVNPPAGAGGSRPRELPVSSVPFHWQADGAGDYHAE